MLDLAKRVRRRVEVTGIATDADLRGMAAQVGLEVGSRPFPEPVKVVYARQHLAITEGLDNAWERWAIAGGIAGVLLRSRAYVATWHVPVACLDLPADARRVLGLAGWIVVGDVLLTHRSLLDAQVLAAAASLPPIATLRWLRLVGDTLRAQESWRNHRPKADIVEGAGRIG